MKETTIVQGSNDALPEPLSAARRRIIDRAEAIQTENRYGLFTNPVVMGLLTAAQIIEGEA